MQVEVRNNYAIIKGYINAVERDSREIPTAKGVFVEQVRCGTWKNAISKKDNIPLLLNHDKNREIASTKEGTLNLIEDNIGLYAEARVYDKDVVEKAKNKKLVGWSFGFSKLKDSWGKTDSGIDRRYLEEIEVSEVSVLDDTRTPAYYGTSIENRDNLEIQVEQRSIEDSIISFTNQEKNKSIEKKLKLLNLELEL
ncbi:HK97 family phage prohead protease [Clostridium phage CWou-2020a]|uniref:Peptidase U35 n=1 Tax=Clostridium botulinum C/D str. DC5 TaxID=1443128 RepID=A0A0A0IJR2_CLOBO|nr:HK97 family phage prohead protease [Clostridium botulinum]QPW59421.1 HK97 family phage prohead protease [Clostridium phage CWou-2020a]KGN00829.1 peptidase U35 [Clostridium botulinum C/D str. DC5]KOC54188.1 peptidase U35 [Clostridium botulinum]KOC56532.1 peptidase U35 [Clostridium botulinum]MCD3240914.1 HK97 family phage prohead protease [Clostridium botulinum D/C]